MPAGPEREAEPPTPQEQLTKKDEEDIEALGAVVEEEGERPEPGTMKIDLHCHSEASPDCRTPLDLFPARCRVREVRVQAITDHNTIDGALRLQEMVQRSGDRLMVIVGEEVSTLEGEIIGLFLKERIEPNLSPEETVERIKAQGGLVLLPHGFDPLKRYRLQPTAIERIAGMVDIVETFNARISRPRWNQAAVDWAKAHNLPMSAGSDAHTLADIGSAWVEAPFRSVRSPEELLEALKDAVPVGEWTHPAVAFVHKMWYQAKRRFLEA